VPLCKFFNVTQNPDKNRDTKKAQRDTELLNGLCGYGYSEIVVGMDRRNYLHCGSVSCFIYNMVDSSAL
jgi:hypothetical protein